jgi:hypothetical protein
MPAPLTLKQCDLVLEGALAEYQCSRQKGPKAAHIATPETLPNSSIQTSKRINSIVIHASPPNRDPSESWSHSAGMHSF